MTTVASARLVKNRIEELYFCFSALLYLKFFLLWAVVLLADFILEFRFEFLWPFWLLLRSVYDSFKYQGLAFSVFFVCIALTSDMICFFFIPVQWLFFAASTYVWVQYVWHTEKGICVPTVALWLLFVYMEAAVRLRDVRHLPFHLDLCRPFAAHCIGYPVVTLGFGFKSYVGFRMRQRKQRDVAKENEFYMQLLQQALPIEQQPQQQPQQQQQQQTTTTSHTTSPEKSKGNSPMGDGVSNGVGHTATNQTQSTKNNHRKSLDKGEREKNTPDSEHKASKIYAHTNGSIHSEISFIEKLGSVNEFDENEVEKDKSAKGNNQHHHQQHHNHNHIKNNSKWTNNQVRDNAVNSQRERKNKANREQHTEHTNSNKDEYCLRLEAEVKRLKLDLHASRQTEQELRGQVNSLLSSEKTNKNEVCQLHLDNEELQSKLHGLVSARQSDKQTLAALEKRVAEERRMRGACEAQLAAERKAKEAAVARAAVAMATVSKVVECTDVCRARRRDLEADNKQLRRELKANDDRLALAEREAQSLRQYKDSHNESEILMSALSAMQDKNTHLENSLSAETRIKLDLFSALGEAKRQLEIRESK
ncbi:macoilin-1 [Nilaparvata lugens]|uniref:macoilin-1 n=1 Tax=Nilaparvata lugens TaxID=108931 RepID=UPI00193DB4CE|nr:macoilin-1 [Nilaparvata lugens]